MVAASLTIMVGSAITPALLQISEHYQLTDSATWLTTLPALGVVLLAPVAGKIIDRFGSYVALSIGLFLYGSIGIAAIWMSGQVMIFADRILLGGATAIVMAASTGLLAEFFQGEKRLKMIALQGMSVEIGGIIFLSIGGILGGIGWRWPFFLYLMGWIACILLFLFVPLHKKAQNQQEEIVQQSPNQSFRDIFPILLAALFAMTLFFVAVISLPFYLSENFGMKSTGTGYFLAFISLIAVISASVMPRVVKKFKDHYTLTTGFFLFTCGYLTLAVNQDEFLLVILAGVLLGFGFGFTIPLANHMTVEKSNSYNRGKNLAYFSSAVFLGQFLSSFIEGLSKDVSTIYALTTTMGICITVVSFLKIRKKERKMNSSN